MTYIDKIIRLARPIVHKLKHQETPQNTYFYQGYENIYKIISEEIFMLLNRIVLNGVKSIGKEDYKRMKSYCKTFNNMESNLLECEKNKNKVTKND